MKKNYLFLIVLFLCYSFGIGQTLGDFRSNNTGPSVWTSSSSWETWDGASNWIAATEYPGQNTGTYTVTISTGTTITIPTNLSTAAMGSLIINGTLILGDDTSNQHITTLSTKLVSINPTGKLKFSGPKVRLILPASDSVLIIEPLGTIDGNCTNNDEIFVNTGKYATCVGSGSKTYSFGDLIASGGTFNAEITIPTADPSYLAEACNILLLEGINTGSTTGIVSYLWTLVDTDITTGSFTTTNISTITTASFTPILQHEYLVTFQVSDDFNTNVHSLIVTALDVTPPVTPTLANVNVGECSGTPTAPTTTDACAGTITGTTLTSFPITTQGTTVVTWTFNDGNGNSSTANQNVTLDDVTAPVPVIANLPDVTGQCSATIPSAPTANDNCGGLITATTTNSLTRNTQGTSTVTWTFDDGNGQIITQTQNIVVDDTTAPVPVIANLPDVTGQCSATIPSAPTANDNCGGLITATTTNSLTRNTQGTSTVTWTFDDGNGQIITQTQNIVVDDTTAPVPVIANLPDVTGQCSATIPSAPTANDNCGGLITATTTNSLTRNTQGTSTVTWTFDDGNGQIITQTQNIVVDDTTAPVPVIANLPDVTGQCSATIPSAPTANDNCGGLITATTTNSLTRNTQGTSTVTWTFDDGNGQIITQTQNIVVDDTTAPVPVIANLPDVTGQCSATIPSAPTANDNCGGLITATTTNSLTRNTQGTSTVTWTFDDGNGQIITQTQNIVVDDTTNPTLTAISNRNENIVSGCSFTIPDYTALTTAADNCTAVGSIVKTQSPVSGTVISGHNTAQLITITANDGNGNTVSTTFTITLKDVTPPTINCPANISVNNTPGTCGAAVTYVAPVGTDNCSGATTAQIAGLASGATFPVGITTNTFRVTDAAGLQTTCSFTVTVIDNQVPVINCPANISVNNTPGTCGAAVTYVAPVGTDNCSGATTAQIAGLASGATFPVGITTNTFRVTDAAGLQTTCSFTVTVIDNQVPVINCPANISVNNTPGTCGAAVTYVAPVGTDNCSGATTAQIAGLASGATFPVGITTNTFRVTDAAGLQTTCSFTVTVIDNQVPVINCPANISVNNAPGTCGAAVTYVAPVGTDNCSGATTAQIAGLASGATFPVGITTNTFRVTDAAGLQTTCSFTVTVIDNQVPVINCPANISVNNTPGTCGAAVTYVAPVGTDNCSGATTAQIAGLASGATFPVGITTNTFKVTDAAGLETSCSFTVTVVDNQVPTLTAIAARNENLGAACSFAIPDYTGLTTAADNCTATGSIIKTQLPVSGTVISGHNTTQLITITANDGNGNTESTTFTITLKDVTAPSITCPATATANTNTDSIGNCTTTVSLGSPTASDNCTTAGNLIITAKVVGITINPSTYLFGTGTTTVIWTATDQNGNVSAPCNQTVTVTDNEKPTASNPAPIVASGSAPAPDITVVINETDNCTANPVVAFVSDTSSGSCPVIVTRIYRVTDNAGNFINVTQTITVNDAIKPIARCISTYTLVVTLDGITGTSTILPSQINNGSTDNCGPITLSLDKSTFGCNDIGTKTVTLTVTDNQGNFDTCSTIITVNAPTINSGTLTGFNVQTQTIANASNVILITACPVDLNGNTIQQDVALTLNINPLLASSINRWEYSTNGGINWLPIANTNITYTVLDVQVTTLVRVVIKIGDCFGFSPIAIISVIPPDLPPTIVNGTEFNTICLGATVQVVVESEYGVGSEVNQGGLFNTANLNNLGWQVDGEAEMSAGGDNGQSTYWKETNGPKDYNGRCYNNNDNTKFAVVAGIPQYIDQPNNVHVITPLSTLETPIFSTLGLTTMQLEFDQAYYLEAGAWLKIEISTDGGATEDKWTELNPGPAYDYTGPSSTGFSNPYPGFTGGCKNVPGTKLNDNHVIIDLQQYIGLTNLRIRFTYRGTTNSVWAIDNIKIPNAPTIEVIEWTDDFGVVVATGSTVSITPVTPGIQNYGATSLINGCRSDDIAGTEFIKIDATLSYAGKNIAPIVGECGEDTVTLAAYDNTKTAQYNYDKGVYNNNYKVPNIAPISPDYPPTGKGGTWSIVSEPVACTGTTSFSNINDPNATFTGKPGTYTLRWTVNGCASDVQVTINSCSQIDFDGANDYITFKDNYDRTGPFSIEMWIKAGDLIGTQSLLSKRDANDLTSGYDLRLNGGSVEFRWGLSNFISSNAIDAITWHHIAVTFNGSTYKLYMDGVEKASANGIAPANNSMQCILGAMDQANNAPNKPVNYYYGWIDELRIWNKALNIEHIRQMMNQEIKLDGGDNVMGEVIPLKISGPDLAQNGTDNAPLFWSDLDGYYRMTVNCGYLIPSKGSLNGRLRNIYSAQLETAPLPYKSANNGLWNDNNTWVQPVVWYTPNSTVFGTPIDWNIVQTSHNINSGDKDITVLGLISTAGKLTIADPVATTPIENNDGQGLWITHYLKLNGTIDLVGESQLVQKRYFPSQFIESMLDVASTGYIERDQQGKRNSFNYNYWSSPVSNIQGIINNTTYSPASVLKDGTLSSTPKTITFGDGAYFADGALSNPILTSNRWIWSYNSQTLETNSEWQDYFQWNYVGNSGLLKTGEGFTMKGTGGTASIDTTQNYVFVGKPNNGNIALPLPYDQTYLVGNPYPSALDADEFILDNLAGRAGVNVFNGALYFWDHFGLSNNHYLAEYEGGYATYTLIGGVKAIATSSLTAGGTGTKIPQRYIPVGQGFFVDAYLDPALSGTTAIVSGGTLNFKNSQRAFMRESTPNSVFLKKRETTKTNGAIKPKIRLGFDSPIGAHRQLLIGVDPNTSNNYDLGYDAPMFDTNENDIYWKINESQFVIQGVPDFNTDRIIPLGMVIANEGELTLKIDELENFPSGKAVYLHDAATGQYHDLKNSSFKTVLAAGNYDNRFSLTFESKTTETLLEVEESNSNDGIIVLFSNNYNMLIIRNNELDSTVNKVSLFNILGQHMTNWDVEDKEQTNIQIPIKNMPSGIYIVKVKTSKGESSKKIVIN